MNPSKARAGTSVARHPRARLAPVRSSEIEESVGVESLLNRDRKPINVVPELGGGASSSSAASSPVALTEPPIAEGQSKVVKSKESRRRLQRANADEAGIKGPKRCKDAIDEGLSLFAAKKVDEAIAMFNLALELPGNAAYRLSGSIREFSCPSDAEENACLYNLACCYCALGKRQAAITCIEGIVENGFDDYDTIRNDPDLQLLRGPELETLLIKGQMAKLPGLSSIFGRKDNGTMTSDPNKKKSWLQW